MAKQKYYAIAQGRQTGIFTDWEECRPFVDRYKNSMYKSFKNREEAIEYLEKYTPKKEPQQKNTATQNITAYVDGSFNLEIGKYGSGVVFLKNNKLYRTAAFNGSDKNMIKMRNVAGEIEAAQYAVETALLQNANITIYYDYEGIKKWSTSKWKAKNQYTQNYAKFMKEAQNKIDIKFIHVKGHSGNKYNDMADALAKKGCDVVLSENEILILKGIKINNYEY